MFGLGLYIYNGEDMPTESLEDKTTPEASQPQAKATRKRKTGGDRYEAIRRAISATQSTQDLMLLYQQHPEVANNPQIKALFTTRKQELLNAA